MGSIPACPTPGTAAAADLSGAAAVRAALPLSRERLEAWGAPLNCAFAAEASCVGSPPCLAGRGRARAPQGTFPTPGGGGGGLYDGAAAAATLAAAAARTAAETMALTVAVSLEGPSLPLVLAWGGPSPLLAQGLHTSPEFADLIGQLAGAEEAMCALLEALTAAHAAVPVAVVPRGRGARGSGVRGCGARHRRAAQA